MPHPLELADYNSTLFDALNGFWQQFFRDTPDLQAYYQASEVYLGQVYLDFMGLVLGTSAKDIPLFNKEYWKLFAIRENEMQFLQGESVAEDRFLYDMPGSIVTVDFLQNTIFDPSVLFEREVDFDIEDDDGYVRFRANPFRAVQDTDGEWMPTPGIAWRYVTIEVGNNLTEPVLTDWEEQTGAQPGDSIRLLAYRGIEIASGTQGRVDYVAPDLFFYTMAPEFDETNIGDTIVVKNAPAGQEQFNGTYIIAEFPTPGVFTYMRLEPTLDHPFASSPGPPGTLPWVAYKAIYFEPFTRDHELDYFNGNTLVGNFEDALPLDLDQPVVYSVVRDVADPDVIGEPLVAPPLPPPPGGYVTQLAYRNLIPGSVKVYARKTILYGGGEVVEGEDYTVDYLRGRITVTALGATPGRWDPLSLNRCDFQYRQEVIISGTGEIVEQVEGSVKQLSLWVPEIELDRFLLYYNFGSLLNRFEASSETYRSFIRGIMYLYMSGPILQRIEAALNVAAGYALVRDDGEILQSYFNGEDASGTADGEILAGDQFTTPSHTFTELDVGGQLMILNPLNEINKGPHTINQILGPNTVELQSSFGLVPEAGLDWVLSREYERVVVTSRATYTYPYNVPMRADLSDTENWTVLTFSAFEVLTEAFTVTDYIEDPTWWHNKTIPQILWDNAPLGRRRASQRLVEHVIDPDDLAQIDDPGLYIDGDDDGVIATDMATSPFRHSVGFILFDRYLKFHMFYVEFDVDLELDNQFKEDLQDIVLVAKPSYTYPYVEPNDAFMDEIELYDLLLLTIHLSFGPLEAIELADNLLYIGSSPTYMSIDDYFRWIELNTATGIVPDGASIPGAVVLPLPGGPAPPEQRIVKITLDATIGGLSVREGVDYTFDYNPTSGTKWTITPLTVWDAQPAGTDYFALAIEIVNLLDDPLPDTTIGFTPIIIDGLDPGYVRFDMDVPPSTTTVTEQIDRPLSLKIDIGGGLPYTYP
jgi:hypothetical protein